VELEHIGQGNGRLLEGSTARNSTSSKYRFFTGDVLFGRLRSYLRKYWHASRDGICTTEIWPLMVNEGRIDSRFLYATIQSDRFIEAASISYGTHMPRADWTVMKNFEVCLPPLPEQRAIAAALSDADGLIGALDALIEKKRAIKQAAMQQLLTGKKRLPGFSGEWETKKIGDLLKVHHGRSQRDIAVSDGKYPILGSGGEIGRTDTALTYKPSVVIGRKGTIDEPQYVSSPFWAVDTLFYTDINEINVNKFVYYKFCMIPWRNYNEASGVPSLNAKTIENIEITIPGYDEQTAIAAVLSDMDAEIAALERRRGKVEQIKQGMMQQLLTGRIRLVEPPEAAA
jgi:type I restriction enzyme S subunit